MYLLLFLGHFYALRYSLGVTDALFCKDIYDASVKALAHGLLWEYCSKE